MTDSLQTNSCWVRKGSFLVCLYLPFFAHSSDAIYFQLCHCRLGLLVNAKWISGPVCPDIWGIRVRKDWSFQENFAVHSSQQYTFQRSGESEGQAATVESHFGGAVLVFINAGMSAICAKKLICNLAGRQKNWRKDLCAFIFVNFEKWWTSTDISEPQIWSGCWQSLNSFIKRDVLFQAFGNAKTNRNDNSSRFGKYMDIQFDFKVCDPCLEQMFSFGNVPLSLLFAQFCESFTRTPKSCACRPCASTRICRQKGEERFSVFIFEAQTFREHQLAELFSITCWKSPESFISLPEKETSTYFTN